RRHTRSDRDWSSDVCSSDLNEPTTALHTHSLTTIVVVDIRDFTPLARTLPEALLSQTIGTWFLRTGQITQRLGSWAQKYVGDAEIGRASCRERGWEMGDGGW